MKVITPEQVVEICAAILGKVGVRPEDARLIGRYKAQNHLYGLADGGAGGIQDLPHMVAEIRNGRVKPEARWQLIRDSPAMAMIDGSWGLGEVVCTAAMKMAMEKAKKTGVAAVGTYNNYYIGRVGQYTETIAENNMIGNVYCGAPAELVAPWGGKGRVFGTNPLSFGMPTSGKPIVVDFATSAVAHGKVTNAAIAGEKVPEGWIMNKDGNPTTDPKDFFAPPYPPEGLNHIGAMLPAARHKGYGLAIVVEILGNVLGGSGYDGRIKTGNGVFLQAINIESFVPLSDYMRRVDEFVRKVKECPKVPGFTEIMLPGEVERKTEEKTKREGIHVLDKNWQNLLRLADELDVNLKEIVP